jgi:hypothetical protein
MLGEILDTSPSYICNRAGVCSIEGCTAKQPHPTPLNTSNVPCGIPDSHDITLEEYNKLRENKSS